MKPGDVLSAEQARNLPDGAVVDVLVRETVRDEYGRDAAASWIGAGSTVTLVSLPTPPDMAPGSVVLDDEDVAWLRRHGSVAGWCSRDNSMIQWSDLAPRVVKVLHDAAKSEGAS